MTTKGEKISQSKTRPYSNTVQRLKDCLDSSYTLLPNQEAIYVNTKTKLWFMHDSPFGIHYIYIAPYKIFSGRRCPRCGRHNALRKDTIWFKKKVLNILGPDYEVLGEYTTADKPIKLKHNKCGREYYKCPRVIIDSEIMCPYCHMTKGENLILQYLDKYSIQYEYQKTFSDLRDLSLLSYDFYLPKYNVLIEYQGIQHYSIYVSKHSKSLHWKMNLDTAINRFAIQNLHDDLKRDYAKRNGYYLLEIPYTDSTFAQVETCINNCLVK